MCKSSNHVSFGHLARTEPSTDYAYVLHSFLYGPLVNVSILPGTPVELNLQPVNICVLPGEKHKIAVHGGLSWKQLPYVSTWGRYMMLVMMYVLMCDCVQENVCNNSKNVKSHVFWILKKT